ncbi:unnamed protein product [Amoebophrya sp. A25]|nr:unnamed protein product [Amoebophrya sp. A25]|eukprot:GSA25T00024481001.1
MMFLKIPFQLFLLHHSTTTCCTIVAATSLPSADPPSSARHLSGSPERKRLRKSIDLLQEMQKAAELRGLLWEDVQRVEKAKDLPEPKKSIELFLASAHLMSTTSYLLHSPDKDFVSGKAEALVAALKKDEADWFSRNEGTTTRSLRDAPMIGRRESESENNRSNSRTNTSTHFAKDLLNWMKIVQDTEGAWGKAESFVRCRNLKAMPDENEDFEDHNSNLRRTPRTFVDRVKEYAASGHFMSWSLKEAIIDSDLQKIKKFVEYNYCGHAPLITVLVAVAAGVHTPNNVNTNRKVLDYLLSKAGPRFLWINPRLDDWSNPASLIGAHTALLWPSKTMLKGMKIGWCPISIAIQSKNHDALRLLLREDVLREGLHEASGGLGGARGRFDHVSNFVYTKTTALQLLAASNDRKALNMFIELKEQPDYSRPWVPIEGLTPYTCPSLIRAAAQAGAVDTLRILMETTFANDLDFQFNRGKRFHLAGYSDQSDWFIANSHIENRERSLLLPTPKAVEKIIASNRADDLRKTYGMNMPRAQRRGDHFWTSQWISAISAVIRLACSPMGTYSREKHGMGLDYPGAELADEHSYKANTISVLKLLLYKAHRGAFLLPFHTLDALHGDETTNAEAVLTTILKFRPDLASASYYGMTPLIEVAHNNSLSDSASLRLAKAILDTACSEERTNFMFTPLQCRCGPIIRKTRLDRTALQTSRALQLDRGTAVERLPKPQLEAFLQKEEAHCDVAGYF